MPTCVVDGCPSGSGLETRKYHLESFPKSEELRQKWIDKLNRTDFELSLNSKICFKHFRKSDFLPSEGNKDKKGKHRKLKKLKPSAVPSRFLLCDPSENFGDEYLEKPSIESMSIEPDHSMMRAVFKITQYIVINLQNILQYT